MMKNRDVAALTEKYVARTYARAPIALVKGRGTKVWDANGKEYLDFLEEEMRLCRAQIRTMGAGPGE